MRILLVELRGIAARLPRASTVERRSEVEPHVDGCSCSALYSWCMPEAILPRRGLVSSAVGSGAAGSRSRVVAGRVAIDAARVAGDAKGAACARRRGEGPTAPRPRSLFAATDAPWRDDC
jgi:hypothetical protein